MTVDLMYAAFCFNFFSQSTTVQSKIQSFFAVVLCIFNHSQLLR